MRKRWKLAWGLLGLTMIVGFADYWLYPHLPIGGQSRNHAQNGIWLRYTWYFGKHSDAEVTQLAKTLQERDFRYAFFHVRYIDRAGNLHFRYPSQARRLLSVLRQNNKNVKAIAWVYVGNDRGEGRVKLSDPEVRKKIVNEAAWLTREVGFDGVQWDYEICPSGDQSFLNLLNETRKALPSGKILSVASNANYSWPLGRFGWTPTYFSEVGRRCDVLAVMGYDSGMYTPRMYVSFIKRQAKVIPEAVHRRNPKCKILIGLPTYGTALRSHNPHSENLRMGLKAMRRSTKADGVALFADYTTDEAEWRDYERWWLKN